ncbi:MAG: hypothetical protein ACODAQ_09550 [Phycisphaeraceae bacterium]
MTGASPSTMQPASTPQRSAAKLRIGSLILPVLLALLIIVPPATAQQNLVANGDFSAGTNDRGEPIGWHTKITSVIAVPEYEDPENKRGRTGRVRYRCGCGEFWPGAVRPWTQLRCPDCGHTHVGLQDAGGIYFTNHERVSITERDGRNVLTLKNQGAGTRAISDLIEAERGAPYAINFKVIASGVSTRVFVEGFRKVEGSREEDRAWLDTLPEEANPLNQTVRLRRAFRRQINPGSPGEWKEMTEVFAAPKPRYHFDYLFVSLYAYSGSGEASFADIKLRKITPREYQHFQRENNR